MSDILDRLRKTTTQSIGYMGFQEVSVSDLQLEAALYIEKYRCALAEIAWPLNPLQGDWAWCEFAQRAERIAREALNEYAPLYTIVKSGASE